MNTPVTLRSKVNVLIWDRFKRAGIEMPYPQRDVYVKEMPPLRGT